MSPELIAAVATIVNETSIPSWLETPNSLLGGRTPSDVLADGQECLIWDALKMARSGDPS